MRKVLEGIKDFSHHAYLVEAPLERAVLALREFFAAEFDLREPHADLLFITDETLTIDRAREVQAVASRMPMGEHLFIILAPGSFAREAQHALLKTLEEPVARTRFVLVAERSVALLPTLLSRVARLEGEEHGESGRDSAAARSFLAMSPAMRLKAPVIKAIVEGKERAEFYAFLSGCEEALHARWNESNRARVARGLKSIVRFRRYGADRGASVKMMLEFLALTLPSAQ